MSFSIKATSSCVCNCCQGRGCKPSFVASYSASSSSQCLATSCTSMFPVQCKKDLQLGGAIQADYNTNANNSGGVKVWQVLCGIIFLLVLIALCCVCISKRRKKSKQNIPNEMNPQPMYNQPVYNQPTQPVYSPPSTVYQQPPATYQQPPPTYNQTVCNPPTKSSHNTTPGKGISPLAAGAVGAVGGLAAGAMLNQALNNSHHHSGHGYDHDHHSSYSGGYGGGYSGGYGGGYDGGNQNASSFNHTTETVNAFGGTEVHTASYSNDGAGNVDQTDYNSY